MKGSNTMANKRLLGGMAIINDSIGKRITYSYSEVDEDGNLIERNKKKSFIVMDEETLGIIEQLEAKVKAKMNE